MSETNSTEKITKSNAYRTFVRYFTFAMLFVLLPLGISGYLAISAIQLEMEKEQKNVENSLETSLLEVRASLDEEDFLRKLGNSFWKRISTDLNGKDNYLKNLGLLKSAAKVDLDAYVFDKSGKLITPRKVKLRSRFLASKLWDIVNSSKKAGNLKFQKIKKPIKTFFGDDFQISKFLENQGLLSRVIARHKEGYVFWIKSKRHDNSGMILVFWEKPDPKDVLDRVFYKGRYNVFRAAALTNEEKFYDVGRNAVNRATIDEVIRKASIFQRPFEELNGIVWKAEQLDNSWVVLGSKFDSDSFESARIFVLLSIFLLFGLFTSISIYFLKSESIRISIRWKLIALFMIAVFSPIAGFCFLGYRYLQDRETTLLTQSKNKSRKLLFTLDEFFQNPDRILSKEFRSLRDLSLNVYSPDGLKSELENLVESGELITYEIRSTKTGEKEFSVSDELFLEGMKEVFDAFSKYCIDESLKTRLSDSIDPMINLFITSPEAGMFFLFDRPDNVHKLGFGPSPIFVYWDLLKKESGVLDYFFVAQSASKMIKAQVMKKMFGLYRDKIYEPYTLLAKHNSRGEWYPAKPANQNEIELFSRRAFVSDKPIDFYVDVQGKSYLVTGQRGKYLKDYSLFAFFPIELIQKDLKKIRQVIVIGILLFLSVAFLMGQILSNSFLMPVSNLSSGVEAIKKRDSTFRIAQGQKDEFGDLAISFNNMIEDLKEMAVAKDVQESLLPSAIPEIPGYDISFENRMASDLGGDYFDLQILESGKLFILIGDVTGHGVSSALVMAMAKATVYQGLKEGKDLVGLFTDLNAAIYTYFKIPPARKMITMFAAILDLQTGEVDFVNAGHNFPVCLKANGDIEDLVAIHLPIGAVKKMRAFGIYKFRLDKGDTIIFYTDGIVEAKGPSEEMYSYERFKDMIKGFVGFKANEIKNSLFKEYCKFLGGCEPDDDVTLIVVKRLIDESNSFDDNGC